VGFCKKGLCKKYFAAYGGKIKFFGAAFSTILLRKIVENAAPKKGRAGGFPPCLTTPLAPMVEECL